MFSIVFGLLLAGVGSYALLIGQTDDAWQLVGGAVLLLVGGNMICSSWRGKPSWLSRLGPLP
jgi:hypothetical protein